MATRKVGIYRSYYGPLPVDASGQPLPASEWPKKRQFSWVVRWFGNEGRRYSSSFQTRKEADRFAEQKQSEVRVNKADRPEEIALSQFEKEHETLMQDQVAAETLSDQLRALRMFRAHVGGELCLHVIRPRDAESFVAMRLNSGVKVATVNKDIRTLRRVFNLAIHPRGYLPEGQNPFRGIRQRKQASKSLRYVSPAEFHRVLGCAETTWWKALLSLAYSTAARLGEIMHLTWADIDFAQSRIRIVRKEADATQSGWEPKDHEGRVLPVPEMVLKFIVDLQAEAAEGCPYVFVPGWRWRHIAKRRSEGSWHDEVSLLNNLNRRLATLRKRAGVAKFTYHDLRRACITNWARHLPTHVVQKLAGHSDIKTTQLYYLSVQPGDLEAARSLQASILAAVPTAQLLTNSGQKGHSGGPKRRGPNTQVSGPSGVT